MFNDEVPKIPLDELCSKACSLRDQMLDTCKTVGERYTAGLLTYNQALDRVVYCISYVNSIYNYIWNLDVIGDDEYNELSERCPDMFLKAFFEGKEEYR